jgi:hypothetical protein
MRFELVCPSSDEVVRRNDPANAGYSRRAITERLDKFLERGHTYEVVYTDKLPPEERTKRYHAAAAEFAIRARRTKPRAALVGRFAIEPRRSARARRRRCRAARGAARRRSRRRC